MGGLFHTLSTKIVDTIPIPLLTLDAELRVVAANQPFYQTFKISPPEVEFHFIDALGSNRMELQQLRTALKHVLTDNAVIENFEITSEFPLIGQHTMLFSASRLKVASTEASQILLSIQDITEYRRAQEAVERSEKRFRALLENSLDGIILSDAEGVILYLSPAITRLFGYTPNELLLKNRFDFIHPDDIGQTRDEWTSLLQQPQRIMTNEYRVQHKDGAYRWLECISQNSLTDPSVEAIVGNFRDITQRKIAEIQLLETQMLREVLEQEKELIELRQHFMSMVSHDFRTPLTIIQASTDLIGNYYERLSPEKRSRLLRDIGAQIKYMVDLLDEVMLVDRAHSGKLQVERRPLDLAFYCKEILDQLQITASNEHRFVFNMHGDRQYIQTDEDLLRRILVNLLSNAIKYSPDGGEVRLEVTVNAEEIILQISDQGIGIPAADQPRLFEVFHRASNTGKIKGTGFGLAIVKASLEALNGRITYQSEEGHGTTFVVHLPFITDAS